MKKLNEITFILPSNVITGVVNISFNTNGIRFYFDNKEFDTYCLFTGNNINKAYDYICGAIAEGYKVIDLRNDSKPNSGLK